MDPFFAWLEASGLSRWVREANTVLAFPLLVVLHALGLALLAGVATAINLRVLGVARGVPLVAMRGFLPAAWVGFAVNAVSGVMLLIGYPTKALTNPVFYAKLALLAAAIWLLLQIDRVVLSSTESATADRSGRRLAALSLLTWMATVAAGRLLAYTHTRLLVDVRGIL
jgi:hypothetical protein